MALFALAFVSCKKDHYDVSQVHGINAEGELLLPLVSKTTTVMDLMERFKIDSLISCADDGSLYYELCYKAPNVVKGSDFMQFDDFEFEEHFDLTNYVQFVIPNVYDTVVKIDLPLQFNSNYIEVLEAWMRSGRFDFNVSSNVDALKRINVHSSDIKDANGNDLELSFDSNGSFGFDVSGLHYKTENANSLMLSLDIYLQLAWTNDPDLYVDIKIDGKDLSLREMRGYLDTFSMPGSIDSTFSIFPNTLSGKLEIKDVRLSISERNLFGIEALIKVDTAMMFAEGIEPYSLLYPIPLWVDINTQMTMTEVFNQRIDGIIQAHDGRVKASYKVFLNPAGHDLNNNEPVSVADTCVIDLQLGVEIPFAFNATDIRYVDTVDISFGEIEMPDLIESLTLDLDISSTLPLNLNGWFYLYDSQTGMVTDTLSPDGKLVAASFNGLPTSTTVSVVVTEDRLANLFLSDRIIMMYEVDTDAHDVKLNAQQELGVSTKAKIKYNGTVEFNDK